MPYLKLALVLFAAWLIAVSFGFAGGQAWLVTMLLAGLAVLFIELSATPPRPYLIWITPKWEAIQAAHRIASDAELRSWLDRSHEMVAASELKPAALESVATERELMEARVAVHGVGIQWLSQNLFLVSGFKIFTSKLEWDFFLEVSRDDPKNTLVFRCRWDIDGV